MSDRPMKYQADEANVPHLLLVCPRPDVLGKLLGLPVAITVVHRPSGDRKLEESLALNVIDADFTNTDELLAAARQVHAQRPIDAVLGLTELSLYPVSVVAGQLGARANSPATVGCAQDKAVMRQRLAECGVDTTGYRVCAEMMEAAEFARECPDGMILKPLSGNGGTGVFLVREVTELIAGWNWTTTSSGGWAWRGQAAEGTLVLAEEYVTGREFSVETLSAAGEHRVLAVTGKHTSGSPHFVEIGHDVPATLPSAQREVVAGAAVEALDAIGYAWGPCHTEIMLSYAGNRATVIEINARQGGDQIWELVQLATGCDMITGAVQALAFGTLPAVPEFPPRGAAIRYLTPAPGKVVAIDGVADALAVPGVLRVSELCRPGDTVGPLGDSWNRTGYIIAAGPQTASAAAAAELAATRLIVHTVTEEPATVGQFT